MPVVTTVECGRQLTRRRDICIAVQDVTDLVRILFLDARQRQTCKALCGMNVKSAKGRIRRGELRSRVLFRRRSSAQSKQEKSPKKIFHRWPIIASGPR